MFFWINVIYTKNKQALSLNTLKSWYTAEIMYGRSNVSSEPGRFNIYRKPLVQLYTLLSSILWLRLSEFLEVIHNAQRVYEVSFGSSLTICNVCQV